MCIYIDIKIYQEYVSLYTIAIIKQYFAKVFALSALKLAKHLQAYK